MHPLVHYAIVEFDRNEMLQRVEMERSRRERVEQRKLERDGTRIGHGLVTPVRKSVLARLAVALRGRTATQATPYGTGSAAARSAGATAAIGCRA